MSYLLCLETATTNCSVALIKDGNLINLLEDYSDSYSHAEKLHCFIDDVMKKEDISYGDIEAITVSKGPGSYTGLRIGVSAAKGLCYALDIPLISIPTLQSLSLQIESEKGYVIPMLDARRMEVYSSVFLNKEQIRKTEAEILDENSFGEYLDKGKAYFIGDGVSKFKNICHHKNAVFVEDKFPTAKEMGALAFDKFKKKQFEDVSYFDPFYLKDFVTG